VDHTKLAAAGDSFFDGDVEYVPFVSEEGRVGYQVNDYGVPVGVATTYIYFNPSHGPEQEDRPNIFVYMGENNDPAFDAPLHYYNIEFKEVNNGDNRQHAGG
jgi:hypothetical protein